MIAIIHPTWDSDIVLDEGELEKLTQGETLSGEIADYNQIGKIFLSKWENDNSGFYFNLNWNKKEPNRYHFEINSFGLEALKQNSYVHGRYDNGLNGSKLGIYGSDKDNFTRENIKFAIQMIKLNN